MRRASLLFIIFLVVPFKSHSDEYGLIAGLAGAAAAGIAAPLTVQNTKRYREELEKTVKMLRQIKQAELTKNLLLHKKIFWLQSSLANYSNSIDAEYLNIQALNIQVKESMLINELDTTRDFKEN